MAVSRPSLGVRGRWSPTAVRFSILIVFVLLAVVHTWPLAARPGVHSRIDNGDYLLNVWAVDWVARTLPVDPAHLFNANIFHPSRLTLAYSEPLILQGVLAMPAAWLGLSPVLTFNLVLLAGFALSGWAFALLVHRDTGSWIAGVLAGSAVAFNAHHLVRLVHIQALHLELVPLVFFALDRLLATGRRRYAALMGASLALQATSSIYLLVFTGWALIWASIARAPEWRERARSEVPGELLAHFQRFYPRVRIRAGITRSAQRGDTSGNRVVCLGELHGFYYPGRTDIFGALGFTVAQNLPEYSGRLFDASPNVPTGQANLTQPTTRPARPGFFERSVCTDDRIG